MRMTQVVAAACGLAVAAHGQPEGLDRPVRGPGGAERALYQPATPIPEDLGAYEVSRFELSYATPEEASAQGMPDLRDFETVEFDLLQTADGFVAPREGLPTVTLTIADINSQPPRKFYASALQVINFALVNEFNRRGVVGIFIAPENVYLTQVEGDKRQDTVMRLIISTAHVELIRSQATGPRIDVEERLDNPAHTRIRERSPIQPGGLIRKDLLDRYALWLNRHPGRRVDAALSPGSESGAAVLDYLVFETKPWNVYFQLSNTGTENTGEWRERFGFVHNQLTSNDDILTLDYITSGFDDTHAILGSYEAPFPGADRLRYRVHGSWNEYTASDVGFADEKFKGDGYTIGGELIYNVYQNREMFLDVFAGAQFQHVSVLNEVVDVEGEDTFWQPRVGIRADRSLETNSFTAEIVLEGGFGGDADELERLGRLDPDDSWVLLTWHAKYSFFLEPLINAAGWAHADMNEDPETWRDSTLAHEVVLSFKGQNSLGHRLIPNLQSVVGGAFTVRGYDESIVASDDSYIFSAEYRFHVPRAMRPNPEPGRLFGKPFKTAPQQIYGRPDWDLILAAFTDFGVTTNSDPIAFENDEEMWSVGLGVELQFRRNMIARLDWGYALEDAAENESGDNRVHFVFTFLY